MTTPPPTVFLVDDDAVQVLILGAALRTAGHRVETFEQPELLLARLSPQDRGCVVLDLRMPGLSGLDLQRALVERGVGLPLIFVSGRSDVPSAVTAMKRGAVDFLAKPVVREELCAVVAKALARDGAASQARAARAEARARWEALSTREQDVCRLLARGLILKQVASTLRLSTSTVHEHRAGALRKLQVSTPADLVRLIAQAEEG